MALIADVQHVPDDYLIMAATQVQEEINIETTKKIY